MPARSALEPHLAILFGDRAGYFVADSDAGGFELAARCQYVAPARLAHRRGVAGGIHDIAKTGDRRLARTFEWRAGPGVERNEIDLGGDAGEKSHQGTGIGRRIVDALQHDIFEGD